MIKLFLKAVYGFDEYPSLFDEKWRKVILYLFLLTTITFILFVPSINMQLNKVIPDFSIENNKLITDYKYDDTNDSVRVCIDTSKNFSKEDIADYYNGALIDSDKMILKNYGIVQESSYKDFQDAGITNKSAFVSFMTVFTSIFGYVFFWIMTFLGILFYALIAIMISFFMRINMSFAEAIKLVIFCKTMPLLLKYILLLFDISMPYVVYFLMVEAYIFVCMIMIRKRDLPKENIIN